VREAVIQTRSAGGVVLNGGGQILVVNQNGTSWSLPKGHVEEGEDALAAARREIYEEAGIRDLTLIRHLGDYRRFRIGKDGGEDESELKTIVMFLFETSETELSPVDAENPEARWVEREEVAGLLTHPKDAEFFVTSFLRAQYPA
jgi:8-oxo-dGTP pyrophosphatase MutT (NUDIX family)